MAKVRLYGDTSGYVDLKAPDVAGDVTITLPNTTGPFATETYVDAAIPAGLGTNVVSTTKTDVFSASMAAGTYSAVTGLTATITPTSTSSKILLHVSLTGSSTNVANLIFRVLRDSTPIGVGDAASNRKQNTVATVIEAESGSQGIVNVYTVLLDSPATTSATTYSVELYNYSSLTRTLVINRSLGDSDSAVAPGRTVSSITAIEVAG